MGKPLGDWPKHVALAWFLVVVLPIAVPLIAGALWGLTAGAIIGAVFWFVLGLIGRLDKALKYSGTSLGAKLKYMLGFPVAGAVLGGLSGYAFASQVGAG